MTGRKNYRRFRKRNRKTHKADVAPSTLNLSSRPNPSRRREVDEPLVAVHLFDDHVEPAVDCVVLLSFSPDQRGLGVVERVIVVGQRARGDKAERHRIEKLDEKAVLPHVGDDGGKPRLRLLVQLALEILEQLYLD